MRRLKDRLYNMKYRSKIFLSMTMVTVVPLILCAIRFYQVSRDFSLKNMRDTKFALMRQTNQQMEAKLEIYEHIIDSMMASEELHRVLGLKEDQLFERYEGYREVLDPALDGNMYYHPEIHQMTFYLKENEIEHGNTVAPYEKLTEKAWFAEQFKDTEPEEGWIIDSYDRQVCLIRPVSQFGKNVGVLVCYLNYEALLEELDTAVTHEEERMMLVNGKGVIVYSNVPEMIGCRLSGVSSKGMIIRSMSLSKLRYRLVCVYPEKTVYQALWKASENSIVLLMACMCYILGMSVIFSRLLVRRTVRLNRIVRKIGEMGEEADQENLEELKRYHGSLDEVGMLIRDVGHMIERLNELRIEVYKEKIAHRDLEMKALQAQINPHFLYNSLSIINWKAIEADADEVSDITLKLAEFYRTTLNHGRTVIDVEGEIRNIRSYVDIQLVMHDNEFSVKWDIDPETYSWQMPKLVLQPLVENALEHGLDLKEEGEKNLSVSVKGENGYLILVVEDNGAGMTQKKADDLIHYVSKGYGVKNVIERIELLYGEDHMVDIRSKVGEGTRIFIRIPGRREEKINA